MAIVLDEQVKFFPTSASLSGSESGGRRFPPGSSPLADSATAEPTPRQTESKYPMHLLIQLKRPILIFLIALACIIGLVPKAQPVSPSPDGGYPGDNTAEDQDAFFSLTTAPITQHLILTRSTSTQPAASPPLPSLFRSLGRPPAATTRPTVQRSLATPPAATQSLNSADPLRKRLWVISKLATATLMVLK